jgi:hypothetical protein
VHPRTIKLVTFILIMQVLLGLAPSKAPEQGGVDEEIEQR